MQTYLIVVDTRRPGFEACAADLAQLGAVELWPGAWILHTALEGQPLRTAVSKLFETQAFILTPFTAAPTTSAGTTAGGPRNSHVAFVDLIAAPIMAQAPSIPGFEGPGRLELLRNLPEGQTFGVNTPNQ